jgi:ubiquinone/menaquinone biosynthesis C-methylase UbiE
MTSLDRSRKTEFTGMGKAYDHARPSYPASLFSQLHEHLNFKIGQTALEIGCGTGKATVHLANCGLSVTAIDIAPDLLAVAKEQVKCGTVRLLESSFEAFRAPGASFDYVVSAQAFHWIDPAVAREKSRALLKRNGALILIWNIRWGGSTPDREALDALYREHAPTLAPKQEEGRNSAGTSQTAYNEALRMMEKAVSEGIFRDLKTFSVLWQQVYTANEYIALLETYSDHKRLQPHEKERLYAAVKTFIVDRGGSIIIPYDTVALTAVAA